MLDNYCLNECFLLFCLLDVNQKYSRHLNESPSFSVSNGGGGRRKEREGDFSFFIVNFSNLQKKKKALVFGFGYIIIKESKI